MNVSIDVSEVAGEPVERAVVQAIESQRFRTEASIERDIERELTREFGSTIGTGGGL